MPSMRQKVGDWIAGRKSSANWFIDWAQIASDEDGAAGGVTVANAYKIVAWVNIAIACRARNLARAPFKLYTSGGDSEVESGPAYELFKRQGAQLWEATEGWRCMRGEAIWILGWGGQVGFPQQIVVVDPSMMEAKLDPTGTKVMLWTFNGQTKIPFRPEEVVHMPMWNPYDNIRGMAELTPVLDELKQEYLTSKSSAKLLSNQSIPGGIITIPGDEMSEEQAERVIEKWEKKHKGINRAGRVAVLGSGATYQKISLSPQEMQTLQTREWNRETILGKYGVPHSVVGLEDAGGTLSGKDTAEQMKAFWNLTLLPECAYFEKKLAEDFFARFKLDLVGEFDTTELWEMQTDEEVLSNRLRMDIVAGVLTINEAREMRGMEPVEWGDTWWRPMSLVDVTEEPEPAPDALDPFAGQNNTPKEDEDEEEETPEEEEPDKSIHTLFVHKGHPTIYTPEYKDMRWKTQFDPATGLEVKYSKELRDFFYRMRQAQLHSLMEYGGTAAIQNSHLEALMDEPMWESYNKELEAITRANLTLAVDLTGKELLSLFADLGLGVGTSWDIWDTRAKDLLEYRCHKIGQVDETIQKAIREKLGYAIENGWSVDEAAESIRDVANIAQNRAPTIARTEIAGAINDSRVSAFVEEGFTKHQWYTANDERVRGMDPGDQYNHVTSNEVTRPIGGTFPCGLTWPHDPAGDPGNVINCRCDTMPVFEE